MDTGQQTDRRSRAAQWPDPDPASVSSVTLPGTHVLRNATPAPVGAKGTLEHARILTGGFDGPFDDRTQRQRRGGSIERT